MGNKKSRKVSRVPLPLGPVPVEIPSLTASSYLSPEQTFASILLPHVEKASARIKAVGRDLMTNDSTSVEPEVITNVSEDLPPPWKADLALNQSPPAPNSGDSGPPVPVKNNPPSHLSGRALCEWHAGRREIPSWDDVANWMNWPLKKEFETGAPDENKGVYHEKTEADLEKERVAKTVRELKPDDRILLGSFTLNYGDASHEWLPYNKPPIQQTSSLLDLLETNGVGGKILTLVMMYSDTALAFSASCRRAFDIVSNHVAIWDHTSGWFHWCENSRADPNVPKGQQGSVRETVIVTPLRGIQSKPIRIDRWEVNYDTGMILKHSQNDVGKPDYDDKQLYVHQLIHSYKLVVSIRNFGYYFQNLQLIRVPFLDVAILSQAVPHMRNLRSLKIIQCPLLHIGQARNLLRIIRQDRPKGKENQVQLDFYPRFHSGPKPCPGSPYVLGSYGITWDSWNAGDSCVAIWDFCSIILRQARKQGQDWESKGTLFRKWLDDGPCPMVSQTLKIIMSRKIDLATLTSWVEYRTYRGMPQKVTTRNVYTNSDDRWKVNRYDCDGCGLQKPAVFFKGNIIRESSRSDALAICFSCQMHDYLENEPDHLMVLKREIMCLWNCDVGDDLKEEWNTNDIDKSISDFHIKGVEALAWKLDSTRQDILLLEGTDNDGIPLGYDVEFNERQRPYTDSEKKGKQVAAKLRSATLQDKVLLESDGWADQSYDHLWQHGYV